MSSLKKFTAIDGRVLEVDTSHKACAEFGFEPNQRIIDPYSKEGTIIGVAPLLEKSKCIDQGVNVLLVAMDNDNGKVCFFPNPAMDLQKQPDKTRTISDFRKLFEKKFSGWERQCNNQGYISISNFLKKLNNIGAQNMGKKPPETVPDIDATVILTKQEWTELEAEMATLQAIPEVS